MMTKQETLGQLIKRLRKAKKWTLQELIKRVTQSLQRGSPFSPSYITRIEADDEIPNPELILVLATVLEYDALKMMEVAKAQYKDKILRKIDAKYAAAFEVYCKGLRQIKHVRSHEIQHLKLHKIYPEKPIGTKAK